MSLDQELLAQIDKYKEIMQKDPNSREFLRLADLYRKLGVAEEAMKILKEGLRKHPTYVDARLSIARIFLTQGQIEEATQEFEEVIHQDVENFVAYKLLGEIAMQKQEHEKAAERFGAAFRIKPDDQECKVMLDYIGSLLGRDVTPQMAGVAAAPKPAPPPPPQPSKGTIAVATEAEFGAFEEAEEVEEIGEFEEELSAPFEEAEEFEEIEEDIAASEGLEEFVEPEDVEEVTAPEPFDEIEDIEEIEDIGEIEEFEEEEIGDLEEIIEDVSEEEVFDEASPLESEEIGDFEDIEEIEDFETRIPEADEEQSSEEIVDEGEEELVAQIFQELSDSKYTSGTEGLLEGPEGELEDLMGLLDSEETAGLSAEYETEATAESESEIAAEDADLETMIDQELEGVEGIETFPEEIEEIEEEIEEVVEEFEEIEELVPFDASEEQEEGEEQSSIFEDFGLGEAEGETTEAESGDVFQNFDFDAFEQELLKDHPPAAGGEVLEEPGDEETPMEEVVEEFVEEIITEEPEDVPEEEVEEAFEEGEEILEEEELAGEEELPTPSLAEMYIKQDLFDEATNIYRKLIDKEPQDKHLRQMLEETLALQSYLEEVG